MTNDQATLNELEESKNPRRRFGFYSGVVEDIDDPRRLGRVKVRVWAIHGSRDTTSIENLPWARIMEAAGGGYDFGSFNPHPVGCAVVVAFEQGIETCPMVFGTFRGIPRRDDSNPNTFLDIYGTNDKERAWQPPDEELETPKEIFEGKGLEDNHPTKRTLLKSYKGHTISYEDGDEKEHLHIIDRAGQIIEFYCPVHLQAQHGKNCNTGNSAQRGLRHAIKGDQLPLAAMLDRKGHIRIKDLAGQEIILDAKSGNEELNIISQNEKGSKQSIELRSGTGKELIRLEDCKGNFIEINPNSANAISLHESSGTEINIKAGGIIELKAKSVKQEYLQKTIDYNEESGKINGDSDLRILGNLKRQVVNSATFGVLGNLSSSIGGSAQIIVTNAGGLPTSNPLQISIVVGGIETSLVAGDVSFGIKTNGNFKWSTLTGGYNFSTVTGNFEVSITTAGDIKFSTLAGNYSLNITSGNISLETLSGDTLLKTLSGTSTIHATNIKLGSSSASEPYVCGNLLVSLLTQLINLLKTHTHPTGVGPSGPSIDFNAAITAIESILSNSNNPANPLALNIFGEKLHIV